MTTETAPVTMPFNFLNALEGFVFPQDVEGYLEPAEGAYLYTAARLAPRGLVVELGSYKGKSAICLAQAGRVYTVDHFLGEAFENIAPGEVEGNAFGVHADHYQGDYFAELKANLVRYGVAEHVEVVVGNSADSAANFAEKGDRVALLFIDAGHGYEAVKADFEAYAPIMAPRGAVAFHDRAFPGVDRFLAELENERGWVRMDGPGQIAVMYPPQEEIDG